MHGTFKGFKRMNLNRFNSILNDVKSIAVIEKYRNYKKCCNLHATKDATNVKKFVCLTTH